jgi:prepilin-type processing-associated H-X9-DG protein
VVIAIIALLLSLLTPSLQQAKALAVRAQCQGTQRAYLSGLRTYLTEHDQLFPGAAPYWPFSPSDWGPEDAWFTRDADRSREGIGDYLTEPLQAWHCPGVVQHGQYVPLPHRRMPVSEVLPTIGVNRTLIPWGPLGNVPHVPLLERCAQRLERVGKPQRTWTFADGDWRGSCHAFHLDMYTEASFYWKSHLDGVNVAYLDTHVAWIDSNRYVDSDDWPEYPQPACDWCDMRTWYMMW